MIAGNPVLREVPANINDIMTSAILTKITAIFRHKPRVGLRSPLRTKKLLRWAKRKKSKVSYIAILCWGKAVSLMLLVYAIYKAGVPSGFSPWLKFASVALTMFYSSLVFWEAARKALRSWR